VTPGRLSRRRFLHGTATAAAAAGVVGIAPAFAAIASAPRMRLVGVASGSGLRPSLEPLDGLAGFDDLLALAGARSAFRWTALPPAPGEATVVVSGFVPERTSLRGGVVALAGRPDPTAVRMVSVGLGRPGRDVPRPVVEIRRTPQGVPYEETFLPAGNDAAIRTALVDTRGRTLASARVPVIG
jgi:hypothetical protein